MEVAFCLLDEEGSLRRLNAGARRLFGLDPQDPGGLRFEDLFAPVDREAGEPARLLREARDLGRAAIDRALIRKDGSEVCVEGILADRLLVLREGKEQAKLQRSVERLRSELHQFAFTVSHDLKAPLRSVKSFSDLLERRCKDKLDGDAREYLGYIADGAREMEQLLTDVLAYSQAGREDKTTLQPVDTGGVLQWALMNVDGIRKETNASVSWDPLPQVMADQTQFAQILQHLLTNAMKFRSERTPEIRVGARAEADGMVEFSIEDNGIGIDRAYHERVFGVFKRLHGREVPGTGIGLAICRKIVEAHGGRIWLESQPGQGSTFRFTLPAS